VEKLKKKVSRNNCIRLVQATNLHPRSSPTSDILEVVAPDADAVEV
jgi:hypothetical protein